MKQADIKGMAEADDHETVKELQVCTTVDNCNMLTDGHGPRNGGALKHGAPSMAKYIHIQPDVASGLFWWCPPTF